jgi:hypothetical protein
MGSRSTYDRRIEQLESAVIARLRRVALHVLAVAEAARQLLRPANHPPRAPVA